MREKVTKYLQEHQCAIKITFIANKSGVSYGKIIGLANKNLYRDLTDEEIVKVDKVLKKYFNYK